MVDYPLQQYWSFLEEGDALPPLPSGYAYLIDNDGSYIVDNDGMYLIAPL